MIEQQNKLMTPQHFKEMLYILRTAIRVNAALILTTLSYKSIRKIAQRAWQALLVTEDTTMLLLNSTASQAKSMDQIK